MIYDYLIIGAGLGGLSAGLNLTSKNKKVIILEKNSLPGGMVSTFKRGRFEFDTSLYDIYDYGDKENEGDFQKLLKKFDIAVDTTLIPFNVLIKDDTNFQWEIKGNFEDWVLNIEEVKKGSTSGIKEFIKITKEVNEAVKALERNEEVSEEEYPNFYKYLDKTAMDALKNLKIPLVSINMLSFLWVNMGVNLSKLNFIDYALFMYKMIFKKDVILNNKNLDFTLKLVKKYQSEGGKIYYNSEVIKVEEKDHLFIVKTKDNLEYKAKNIIGDIFKKYFFRDLDYTENKDIIKLENARSEGANGIVVFLGLNKSREELGLNYYKYYHYNNLNSDICVKYMSNLDHNTYEVIVPNVVNEEASPKNTCMVILKKLYFGDVFRNLNKMNYEEIKENIAQEIEIATPLTILRYSGSLNGSLFGYSKKGYDGVINRLINYQDEEIPKISFVGSSSVLGSGADNAFRSGVLVTDRLLKKGDDKDE